LPFFWTQNIFEMAAERIEFYNFYLQHAHFGRKHILSHFQARGWNRVTIYKYWAMTEEHGNLDDRRKFNHRPVKINGKALSALKRTIDHTDNRNQRGLAERFKVNQSTVSRTLANCTSIKYRPKQTCPKYKDGQEEEVKRKAGLLYRHVLLPNKEKFLIMDDESYITMNGNVTHGRKGYYSSCPSQTPTSIKYSPQGKFPAKIGWWVAISDFGVSEAFIWHQGLAINSDKYISECIQERLVPFIDANVNRASCIFWPDMAPAHYAKKTQTELKNLQLELVPRQFNPPNLPQARPIERFHSHVKAKVFANGFMPKSVLELEARLVEVLDDFHQDPPQWLSHFSRDVRSLLNKVWRHGPLSVHK
jgi:hypothetical protein